MSISGAVMILFTMMIRSLFIRILPKRMFSIMWWITAARFLIPYSLPCEFSIYSLLGRKRTVSGTIGYAAAPFIPDHLVGNYSETPTEVSRVPEASLKLDTMTVATVIWLVGALTLAALFAFSYIKCMRKFRESLPVENEFISQWLYSHKLRRAISVRYSDKISSPLTYGIFRPTILLPKNFEEIDHDDLGFVLAHEYTHIRRFDTLFKLVLSAAMCVHWFNPAVWLMYFLANRDIEYSCDEGVMCMLGGNRSQDYAMALVRMEEARNGCAPLINSFGKSPIKERIVSILKFKKITAPAVAAAACLIAATTTVFATTAAEPKSDDNVIQLGKYGEVISGGDSIDETSSDNTSSAISAAVDSESKQETSDTTSAATDSESKQETSDTTSAATDSESKQETTDEPTLSNPFGGKHVKSFWKNRELLPPFGGFGICATTDIAILSYMPARTDYAFEPIWDFIKPERILTFDSFDDILHPDNGDYTMHFKYHEDGSVTVSYYNIEDEPLDFSNAWIEINDGSGTQRVKPDHEVHFREESIS